MKKVFGTKHQREVKRMQPTVDAISALEDQMVKLSDAELRARVSEDGRAAFLDRYNWESTSAELVTLYDGLSRRGGGEACR